MYLYDRLQLVPQNQLGEPPALTPPRLADHPANPSDAVRLMKH
jgi:hypothetical protein